MTMHDLKAKSPRRGLVEGFSEETIPRREIHREQSTRSVVSTRVVRVR